MAKKTVKFEKDKFESLPQDKPVVYKILDKEGENIYTGTAKRGNVQSRLNDHLPGGQEPIRGGAKVQIEQMKSINEAKKKEENIISRSKPKHNKQGK